jgi:CheY-like chemotaxis protein
MATDKYRPLLRGLHVLVVDDDDDSRVLMETMLRYHGGLVLAVESAKVAHRVLAHVRPDVIVSDLAMPEEDGVAFIRALRSDPKHAATHALAVTAYGHQYSPQQLRAAGFTGLLRKPLDPDDFARAVIALGVGGRATTRR